jgi:N6-adenosine-specific RNA methylase IME4
MNQVSKAHSTPTFPIDKITVGDRFRKDYGNIVVELAKSIERVGLINPITVDSKGNLRAGGCRLQALRSLGWKDVPVRINDTDDPVLLEHDENVIRKPFKISETVAIADELERLEKIKAKERQREGGRAGGKASGKLPEASKGQTRDRIAKAICGWSGRTLEKACAVVLAAKERPELAHIVETMDRTGNINGAFKKLRIERIRNQAAAEPPPPLGAMGVYRCIYADPPWRYEDSGCEGAAEGHYPTMSIEELMALPVGDLAHPDGAHLWLWTTMPQNRDRAPHRVLEAWGFRWVGEIMWLKPSIGNGHWLRSTVEMLILAEKGNLPRLRADQPQHYLEASKGEHSTKPEGFYPLIESFTPGPRIEVFARRAREGWARWGLEAPPAVPAAAAEEERVLPDSGKTGPDPGKKLTTIPGRRRGEDPSTQDTPEFEAPATSAAEPDLLPVKPGSEPGSRAEIIKRICGNRQAGFDNHRYRLRGASFTLNLELFGPQKVALFNVKKRGKPQVIDLTDLTSAELNAILCHLEKAAAAEEVRL